MKHFTDDYRTTLCLMEGVKPTQGPVDCEVCLHIWSGRMAVHGVPPRDDMPAPCVVR